MSRFIYSDEEFAKFVKESFSIAHLLRTMQLVPIGGNYKTIHKRIKRLTLDTSHFTGMLWSKGKKTGPKRNIEDYLSNKFPISSYLLKKRIVSEGLLPDECHFCKISEWQGKPISLELDHIDGNSEDNSLENLRILCPNCHSQTPTFRGRNKKAPIISEEQKVAKGKRLYKARYKKDKVRSDCPVCHKEVFDRTYCSMKCYRTVIGKTESSKAYQARSRKVVRPSKEELLKMLEAMSFSAVGRHFSVSDNAIRKWLKQYEKESQPLFGT